MRDPKETLRDMLEAIAAIEQYQHRDKATFERDKMLQVWFLRHLQIIGEADRSLSDEVRNLAPDIPWSKIIGIRNTLVHNYFDIDTEIVWNTVQQDIPELKSNIEGLLRKLEELGYGV